MNKTTYLFRFVGNTFVAGLLSLGLLRPSAAEEIYDRTDVQRRTALEHQSTIHRMVMMPMRDGVRLATRIYLPKQTNDRVPTIFWRTPYNFSERLQGNDERPSAYLYFALRAIENGYAFVIQNERGRYFSEGDWEILGRPRTDGADALDWISQQPWSNGRVATLGCSSTAEWQLALGAIDHPAHAAAVPMAYGAGIGKIGEYYEQGNMYRGGALQQSMIEWMFEYQGLQRPQFPPGTAREDLIRLSRYTDLEIHQPPLPDWSVAHRHLPMSEQFTAFGAPKGVWNEMASLSPADPQWNQGGLFHEGEAYGVPTLWISSWYDLSSAPNLDVFNYARTSGAPDVRDHQFCIVAPTVHCAVYRMKNPLVVGQRNMGDARFGLDELLWRFLDRYTKPVENHFESDQPRVMYYAMGENKWRTSSSWPPEDFELRRLYLRSQSGANSIEGDGKLSNEMTPEQSLADSDADRFTYDPANPVPSLGGNLWGGSAGSFDNRKIEQRQDVLVYTSDPFRVATEVTGKIRIRLFVSSDARDTDFTVKLLDVAPDGTAWNLDETIQRARYREGYDRQVWMQPDKIVQLDVSPITTSNTFLPGHRLRIEVSSSNFPRFQRNLNLGTNNFTESRMSTAINRVHHSPTHASYIEVPMRERPQRADSE